MPRLRRVNRLCSSTLSVNCEYFAKQTQESPDCRTPFRSGHMYAICARLSKGKGRFTRGWKPQVSTLLCPRRVGALPAEVQRKTSRPSGRTRLRQFASPGQPVQKRSRPLVANTLTQFAFPGQPVPKNLPPGSRSPRSPYAAKTKKAPLTRCLSLLWICRPLSSSSCRNYRSRRRYYHHRYRRNRSRRCPDRSIPRSG